MKKLIAAMMVTAMMLSMSGCFLANGNQYKKAKKKVFEAAQEAFGVQELSDEDKELLMDDSLKEEKISEEAEELLSEGIFAEITKEEIEARLEEADVEDQLSELGTDVDFTPEDMENVCIVGKKTGENEIVVAMVIDFKKKSTCEDMFDELYSSYEKTATLMNMAAARDDSVKCELSKGKKDLGFLLRYDKENLIMAVYIERAGDTITLVTFAGPIDSDLYEEFLEFDDIAGFAGFSAMAEEME